MYVLCVNHPLSLPLPLDNLRKLSYTVDITPPLLQPIQVYTLYIYIYISVLKKG